MRASQSTIVHNEQELFQETMKSIHCFREKPRIFRSNAKGHLVCYHRVCQSMPTFNAFETCKNVAVSKIHSNIESSDGKVVHFILFLLSLSTWGSCLPSTLSVRRSLPHEWRLISIRHNHTRLVSMCETMQTVKRPLINDQKWNANTCLINCSFLLRIALSCVRITAETNSLNSSHIIQNQCNAMLYTRRAVAHKHKLSARHTWSPFSSVQRRDAICEWRKTIEN